MKVVLGSLVASCSSFSLPSIHDCTGTQINKVIVHLKQVEGVGRFLYFGRISCTANKDSFESTVFPFQIWEYLFILAGVSFTGICSPHISVLQTFQLKWSIMWIRAKRFTSSTFTPVILTVSEPLMLPVLVLSGLHNFLCLERLNQL